MFCSSRCIPKLGTLITKIMVSGARDYHLSLSRERNKNNKIKKKKIGPA